MGVVNVTPDSFSDGGVHIQPAAAAAAGWRMLAEGAAIVDVGGESTRPGSAGVPVEEELRRVVPVLESLHGAPISIDTAKAEVARRAIDLDAELVNDVTALRGDPRMAEVVAESGAYLCLMHMQGEPRTMQQNPTYSDVASEVAAFLEERLRFAVDAGISEDCIALDPGIGFGKTVEQNFEPSGSTSSPRSAARSWSASRARARSVASSATRRPRRARSRRASPRRLPPTSAVRPSSASTTCASTSKRSPSRRRWPGDRRGARARAFRPARRQ